MVSRHSHQFPGLRHAVHSVICNALALSGYIDIGDEIPWKVASEVLNILVRMVGKI